MYSDTLHKLITGDGLKSTYICSVLLLTKKLQISQHFHSAGHRHYQNRQPLTYPQSLCHRSNSVMLFTKYFALSAAALATANPLEQATQGKAFVITNFIFGCTIGCDWSFNVVIQGSGPNHPPVKLPVKCSGNTDNALDYTDCGVVSDTQKIRAYVTMDTNVLNLEYDVQKQSQNLVYHFTGELKVRTTMSTGPKKQKKKFMVKEMAVSTTDIEEEEGTEEMD